LRLRAYIARGGQIIDATIVSVPKQRSTKEENETIKASKTPEGWEQQPAKNAQKDKDARWTKKNDASFFGCKNHLGVDKAHKLIRKWDATDAAVHDSRKLDDVLDLSNTGKGVWADSAYRSVQIEAGLKAKGLQSHSRPARSPISRRIRRTTRRCTPRSISSAASKRTRHTRRTPRRRSRTRVRAYRPDPLVTCGVITVIRPISVAVRRIAIAVVRRVAM
jgi:transposase, IS5 family